MEQPMKDMLISLLTTIKSEVNLYNTLINSPLKAATFDHIIEIILHLKIYDIHVEYTLYMNRIKTNVQSCIDKINVA